MASKKGGDPKVTTLNDTWEPILQVVTYSGQS